MVLVYGRRRVGKSTLIKQWGLHSGLPFVYWEAPRLTAENVRASLARELLTWAGEPTAVVNDRTVASDWVSVFRLMRRLLGVRPSIVVLDEFPWAVESEPGLPSILKSAWDNIFADTQIKLIIAGSHISAMEKLLHDDAPLYGRLSGKLHVRAFTLPQISPFLKRYSLEKRLAVYSIIGGIPDYLKRWDDGADLMPNIREILLSDTSPFRNEHSILISDVLRRDSADYESVLGAIGRGKHDLDDIATESGVSGGTARAANVLGVLEEVRLVERRIRATIQPRLHSQARYAKYHLADPFLQFYYRFVEPHRSRIALELYDEIEPIFREQLRGFVAYTFEAICRQWTLLQARNGGLPLSPDFIGSDWSKTHQADVVAINWQDRQVMIGEAKWGDALVDHQQWRDFLASAQGVMDRLSAADAEHGTKAGSKPAPRPWQQHLILFARKDVTAHVRKSAAERNARIVTYPELFRDLESLPEKRIR